MYYSERVVALEHIARFLPAQLTLRDAIDLAEIPTTVRFRRISGMSGWRPLNNPPHPPIALQDGSSIRITVHEPPPDTGVNDHDDVSRDRSRTPRRIDRQDDETPLLAHHVRHVPTPTAIIDNPEIAQFPHELHGHLDPAPGDHAASPDGSESESSPTASTYESEEPSHFFHIFCLNAEMVAARIQTTNWAMMISNIRNVLGLHRHQLQQLYIVTHRPGDLQSTATQVALVQRHEDLQVGDDRRYVLVDLVFHEHQHSNTNTHRSAQLLPDQITRQGILQRLGVAEYCNLPGVRRRCLVRLNHRRIPMQDQSLRTIGHADYIRVDMPPYRDLMMPTRYIAIGLRDGISISGLRRAHEPGINDQEPWETVITDNSNEEDCDQSMMIQIKQHVVRPTAGTVAHTQRPTLVCLNELIPEPPKVQVDLSRVGWAQIELRNCPIPFQCQLPDSLDIPDESVQAIASLIDPPEDELPIGFHFYVDGSKVSGHQVGAAVLLLCEYHDGLSLGGHICCRVDDAEHAHLGEHAATTWALLWALKCSTHMTQNVPEHQVFYQFSYDAMTTGMQAAG